MNSLSVLGLRLALPAISFSSNLILLGYFGVDRFATLTTLLQGCLLATVLLKLGADDALLYGRTDALNRSQKMQPEVLLGLTGLIPLVALTLLPQPRSGTLINTIQVLTLGFLNAQLAIAAMRLQVQGYVWLGNIAQSIATPVAAIIGATILPTWLPSLSEKGDYQIFFLSIGAGFFFCLILLSILSHSLIKKTTINSPTPPTPARFQSITRSLWMLQIIDVLLLSGDIILLGLFNKLDGLGQYISASRLAIVSAFLLLAAEQYLATIQRSGRQLSVPFWLLPAAMLFIIPIYVLFLAILDIKPNIQYDLMTLIILMVASAIQSSFLRSKVRWAGQSNTNPLQAAIARTLLTVLLATCTLCWFGLELGMSAPVRAICFGALALLSRWALFVIMEGATKTHSTSTPRCL